MLQYKERGVSFDKRFLLSQPPSQRIRFSCTGRGTPTCIAPSSARRRCGSGSEWVINPATPAAVLEEVLPDVELRKGRDKTMQLGMIGLGRMGANMVRRLIRNGHQCVVYDRSKQAVDDLVKEKAAGATSVADS